MDSRGTSSAEPSLLAEPSRHRRSRLPVGAHPQGRCESDGANGARRARLLRWAGFGCADEAVGAQDGSGTGDCHCQQRGGGLSGAGYGQGGCALLWTDL
jgi:hypothetical protein